MDKYNLRVGIDFEPAKRNIRDFAAESKKISDQLAANVARASREVLALGAQSGTPQSNKLAGLALSEIKRDVRSVQAELERAFRAAGHALRLDPKVLTADIDRLMRSGRKGFNQATIGGAGIFDPQASVPIPRQGLLLPKIREGFVAGNEAADAASKGASARGISLIQEANEARQKILSALQDEEVRERAKLGDMSRDSALTHQIAGERVRIASLLAQQRGREQRATTEAQFAQQSELTLQREKVASAVTELGLTQRNPALVARIAEERATLASVLARQAAIERQALAAANQRLGLTARVSNVGDSSVRSVQAGQFLSRGDPNALASINQSVDRAFRTTQAAATQQVAAARQNTTRFQQLYNYLHSRGAAQVGPNGQAVPPTLGRFLGTRALSTAAFGLTGGLLYGGLSFARELITEAQELQVQLGITESVFESFGGTINGLDFSQYKQNVLDISRATGVSADIVASISRQLSGAFATATENVDGEIEITPNVRVGSQVATQALQLSKITGLPEQEIADSFSASVLAFTEDGQDATEVAQRLGDAVVGLEARFGVSTSEVLNFTASLAPMASEMNFSLEQLAAFGAVVEQALGSDVAAAENIGRIFAGLNKQIGPLSELLESGGVDTGALVNAVGAGDLPQTLREVIKAYDQIKENSGLKQAVGELIAGERNARTFFAVLDRGPQIFNALETGSGDFTGDQAERWEKYQDTVAATFERMQRAVEEFGLALFDAGLVDALIFLADAGSVVADAARLMLDAFGALNDLMGGLPAKLLAAAAAFKILGLAGGFLFGGRGAAAAGGLSRTQRALNFVNPLAFGGLSPYSAKASITGFAPYTGIPIGAPTVDPRIGAYPTSVERARALASGNRVPAKYGLRGLAAGNAGKIGQTLAGATATLAPLAAGIAVMSLLSEMQSTAQAGDDARNSLREQTANEIAAGVSPSEMRRRIESRRGGENDFGTDFVNTVTSGFGLLGDSKNSFAVAMDEVQKAEKSRVDKQLTAILDSGFLDGNEEAVNLVNSFKNSAGTNDDARAAIDALILEAQSEGDDELAQTLQNLLAEEETKAAEAKANADAIALGASGELEAGIAELEVLFKDGKVSVDRLIKAYKASAANQRRIYRALRESQPEVAIAALNKVIADEEAAKKAEADDLERRYSRSESVVGALTGNDPKALIAIKKRRFNETDDPDQRLALAMEIRTLQQEILNKEASMAETAGEELDILLGGFTPDSTAAELLIAQVSLIDPVWISFLEETFGSVEQAADYIEEAAALAIEQGISFVAALAKVIEGRIPDNARQAAQAMIDRYRASGAYSEEELQQIADFAFGAIDEVEGRADAVRGADLPDPGAGIGKDPAAEEAARQRKAEEDARERERKADEARREAQALEMANLDIAAARAEGDTLELARIARRKAEVSLRFATTGSEKAAAYAEIISADNQIKAALAAQTEAQRDLAVARAHDDPVDAARAALKNAKDAQRRAKGAQAQAEAQAATIRAQRDLQDAIIGLADAQTDILIAQAEAAGDTVKAAQLSLDKIRRQLARKDLGLTERRGLEAERVQAEAAVRDARLSEERATIDYQLAIGQITKGQAIASLQALLQIPKLTEEQIREINLAIKDLRSQLGQDFQFNLPSQLNLPTSYEVRRLGQTGGTGAGYQDNRNITVQVSVATDANPDQIAAAVASAVGEPNRLGTYAGRY